jgi:putative ABC transport system permease protein
MAFLFRIFAIFTLTFKRLWAQRGLTAATLTGLVVAVALITTVPLYADAVSYRILTERLSTQTANIVRPPFAYMYNYVGAWKGPLEWEAIAPADAYLRQKGALDLGLPLTLMTRHIETDNFRLYPVNTADYSNDEKALGYFSVATTEGLVEHIEIIEGQFPEVAGASPNDVVQVLVSETMATELGVQVGDRYILYDHRNSAAVRNDLLLEIAGVWRPLDPKEPFWFFRLESFDDLLFVPEGTFTARLAPTLAGEVYYALWYLVLDGSEVGTTDVSRLTSGARKVEIQVESLLPFAATVVSPVPPMQNYQSTVERLTLLLTAYDVPIVILILAFIALIVGLAVEQRRNEIAVMRSRGATPAQVVGIAAFEGLLLGALAWLAGTGLGVVFTQLMGRAQSFLNFSADTFLRIALTPTSLQAGLLAMGLALAAQVIPTLAASQDTIITYKQEQARSVMRPWWQRAWLDVLLLIPAGYGFYLLQEQGALLVIGETASETDPFQNPLLLLLPALTVFAVALLFLRVMPVVMEGLRWLLFRTDSVGMLMAVQQLARTPRLYTTPLVLLALTVSLSIFTASLAQTMDYQLFDSHLYRVGADVNLTGPGVPIASGGNPFNPNETQNTRQAAIFLPMTEYETFPGVAAATRVGTYLASTSVGGRTVSGTYLGIDRTTFGSVAFWRYDFADYRLGSLLNALATSPDALLVSNHFLASNSLRVGDFFRLDVRLPEGIIQVNAQIVGGVDYFPTWYPETNGALFVGNLDALFTSAGTESTYNVWLRTHSAFDEEAFGQWLRTQKLFAWRWNEPYTQIIQEQVRPERQGLFGLLSVGFLASALVTVLGYFMYALFSFRRRFIELGILRAVGLSQSQLGVWVACELGFLIITGLVLGTGTGVWVSQQFIPYLQIGATSAELIPPYLVEISWAAIWQITGLFVLLFGGALAALAVFLRRMKVFQAIKLGQTV